MTAPVQVGPSPSGGGPFRPIPLVREYPKSLTVEPRTYLTRRERQVLVLVANGNTNRAIASELLIGEETVKSRVKSILRKLRVNDRAQAASVGIKLGLVPLDEVQIPPGANRGYGDQGQVEGVRS